MSLDENRVLHELSPSMEREGEIFHQLSLARGGNQPCALESLLTTWRFHDSNAYHRLESALALPLYGQGQHIGVSVFHDFVAFFTNSPQLLCRRHGEFLAWT